MCPQVLGGHRGQCQLSHMCFRCVFDLGFRVCTLIYNNTLHPQLLELPVLNCPLSIDHPMTWCSMTFPQLQTSCIQDIFPYHSCQKRFWRHTSKLTAFGLNCLLLVGGQAFGRKEKEEIEISIQEGIDIIRAVLILGMEKAVSGNRPPR